MTITPSSEETRFYAYGGTRFVERVRFGFGSKLPVGLFQDYYGLEADQVCFGVGFLERRPLIVYRERQNPHERGGYPFALLLDPGDRIWRRHHWNGAIILQRMLEQRSGLCKDFFEQPEQLSAQRVAMIMDGLAGYTPTGCAPLAFGSLLAASIVKRAGDVVETSPQAIGKPERPSPSAMAAALERLPETLRIGHGWLIGGGASHAKALGIRLLVDERADPGLDPKLMEDGQRVFEKWERMSLLHSPRSGTEMIHPWEWPSSGASFLEFVEQLSRLATSSSNLESFCHYCQSLAGEAPLAGYLGRIAIGVLETDPVPIGPHGTRFLATAALDGHLGRRLPASIVDRLDSTQLIEALADRRIPPEPFPAWLDSKPEVQFQSWLDYVRRSPDPAGAVRLALGGPAFRSRPKESLELVRAGLEAAHDAGQALEAWADMAREAPLAQLLEEEAKRRADLRRPASWMADFLLFGDRVTEWLQTEPIDDETVGSLFQCLANSRPIRLRQTDLMAWLPLSPFRRRAALHLKLALADQSEDTAWERLIQLEALHSGGAIEGIEAAPDQERFFLLEEWGQFCAAAEQPRDRAPNLVQLLRLLPHPPEGLSQLIAELQPPLAHVESTANWLRGLENWEEIGKLPYQKECLRAFLELGRVPGGRLPPPEAFEFKYLTEVTGRLVSQGRVAAVLPLLDAWRGSPRQPALSEAILKSVNSDQLGSDADLRRRVYSALPEDRRTDLACEELRLLFSRASNKTKVSDDIWRPAVIERFLETWDEAARLNLVSRWQNQDPLIDKLFEGCPAQKRGWLLHQLAGGEKGLRALLDKTIDRLRQTDWEAAERPPFLHVLAALLDHIESDQATFRYFIARFHQGDLRTGKREIAFYVNNVSRALQAESVLRSEKK